MRIGLFTSGGDAPGMNACIRAVVRTAIYKKMEVIGVMRGYNGMIDGNFISLGLRSVSNIIQRGGTILETGRSKEFYRKSGRKKAADRLKKANIDALIGIGGDGTFHGLHYLDEEFDIPAIGLPGTIDNDLYGTNYTIGYDTACDTAMQAIDRIRDTAAAHERVFLVEVMGRHAGFIGVDVGIACGAEEIIIPETKTDVDGMCKRIVEGRKRGKTSSIIVVSEGDEVGGAIRLGEEIKKKIDLDFKVCILGHVQRGGAPTVKDRVLASKLGYDSILALQKGKRNIMVGEISGKINYTKLRDTWKKKKKIDRSLLNMGKIFSK